MKAGDYVEVKKPKFPKIYGAEPRKYLSIREGKEEIKLFYGDVFKLSSRVKTKVNYDSKPYPLMNLEFAKKIQKNLKLIEGE